MREYHVTTRPERPPTHPGDILWDNPAGLFGIERGVRTAGATA